jgi:drug/metabolite transporter (DMT)-like permease
MNNGTIKVTAVFVMICLLWGSTWLAIRVGLESLTPMISAGIRFLIASLLILLIMKFRNIKPQSDKTAYRLYFVMGIFSFVIPFGLVYWAEQFVPSGLASVLFAVYPFFVAIFSFFVFKNDKIGLNKMIGIVAGFTGIVIIFSESFDWNFSDYFLGMLAIVLSGTMQAAIAVSIKKFGGHLHPLSMNFVPMLLAAILMLLIGVLIEDKSRLVFDFNAAASVLYLGVFGSVFTFTGYYWLLKRINIIVLSLVAFITPIIALLLGWIFYNEQLTFRHLVGSMLVLFGLLSANIGGREQIKKLLNFRNYRFTGVRKES